MDSDEVQYHHLLSTNDEPSSMEILEIQRAIEEREATTAKLDAEIVAIRHKLDSLAAYLTQKQATLARFRCVLAPIRRLPPEILATIFLFTRDWAPKSVIEGALHSVGVGPYPGPSPLRIMHVCSKWRWIALSVPKLWTTITARDKTPTSTIRRTDAAHDERLRTWLARTGTVHPLDITIHGRPWEAKDRTRLFWIQPYTHRIKELSLTGRFKNSTKHLFPILERLTISDFTISRSWKTGSFPSLRRVGIYGCTDHFPTFVPWLQLTALDLNVDRVNSSDLLRTLSWCSALVRLEIAVDHVRGGPTGVVVNDNIRLPHLISLEVLRSGDSRDIASVLLHVFTLPSLVTMTVAYDIWFTNVYGAFQSRSLFPLQSLTLSSIPRMDTSAFISLLRETPSLTEVISFDAVSLVPELVAYLKPTTPGGAPELLPKLEYLAFQHSYGYNLGRAVDDETILDMVASCDPSGEPAFLETSIEGLRVFRSHLPMRRCESHIASDRSVGRDVHIYF
ncbi:hypothetical protein Hypma_004920 [Hypsizygus marmoreus]|uniref:Uncharacterized protein n=1 Tax=Hypsizygus marmoreus TaxID=39966 RepID=A0A369KJ04_HYPMA|nr:hypothetical protein Hypma_004920 [Hypsizygus marmoreus]